MTVTLVCQVEINPTHTNEKLIQFAKSKNIQVSSYAPLGAPGRPWYVLISLSLFVNNTFICLGGVSRCLVRFNGFPIFRKEGGDPSALKDPVVTGIASRKGKSPAQVR